MTLRELKFRAWVGSENTDFIDMPSHYEYDVTLVNGKYADVESGWDIHGVFENVPIEQATGLKDKHGKEIYTGDIVEALIDGVWSTGNNSVGFGKAKWKLEVIHNDIRFMDVFRVIGSKNAPDRIYYLFDKELSELEVIGNIHENPELLEAKNER